MSDRADIELDQIWYTWSEYGLDQANADFRPRAASDGLRDVKDTRYRLIDAYLRYDLPKGRNINDFTPENAPVCLALVRNRDERLLVRKVFRGKDYSRNSNYFSHLIAGLPEDFTAREAIRLWYCPYLWEESDKKLGLNDKRLEKVSYQQLRSYAKNAILTLEFVSVQNQLIYLLKVFLTQGVPQHLYVVGDHQKVAALIWGITHCIPAALLPDLTFSTYETEVQEATAKIAGTVLVQDLPEQYYSSNNGTLAINFERPRAFPPLAEVKDVTSYTTTTVEMLMTNPASLDTFIEEAEARGIASLPDLLTLFKRLILREPLSPPQVTTLVRDYKREKKALSDPFVQRESARILCENPKYWKQEGLATFQNARATVIQGQGRNDVALLALSDFLKNVALNTIDYLEQAILQFNGEWDAIQHRGEVVATLAQSPFDQEVWPILLNRFFPNQPNPPIYAFILKRWNVQEWILSYTGVMKPPPSNELIYPWLVVSSWEKLKELLALSLPVNWYSRAITVKIGQGRIPKEAVPIIAAHEAKFLSVLEVMLRSQQQQNIDLVVQVYQVMVENDYKNHVRMLLRLLNVTPSNSILVERLLAVVALNTPNQFLAPEIDTLVGECSREVLACCSYSKTLAAFVRYYVVELNPEKLKRGRVQIVLEQLQNEPSLPADIRDLIIHWKSIDAFLAEGNLGRDELENLSAALQAVLRETRQDRSILFADMLILQLVSLAASEGDLIRVIDTLGIPLMRSGLNLLHRMAEIAGKEYINHRQLDRLVPFILCGINEAHRTKQPPEFINRYLNTLLDHVESDVLKAIDDTMNSKLWTKTVYDEWDAWVRREMKRESVPNLAVFGQSPTTKTPNLVQRLQGMRGLSFFGRSEPQPLPRQQPYQSTSTPATVNTPQLRLAGNMANQLQPPAPQPPPPVQTVKNPEFAATIGNMGVPFEWYQKVHVIVRECIPYQLAKLQGKPPTKSFPFELEQLKAISASITGEKQNVPSRALAAYLIDDYLIRNGIERVTQKMKGNNFLDPSRSLDARFAEFQQYMGPAYQMLTNKTSYSVDDIKRVLLILIRREKFIGYMDAEKQHFSKWLDSQRAKSGGIIYYV